ncbi:MAG TPA: DUF1549 domain-containing protein, partial [Thermoanaerobaculia bacterium]|nr:DUF1549 domain-containing protein [Thermoanaerobaculia bacterium]
MIAKPRCALLLLALAAFPVSAGPPVRAEEDGASPRTLPAAFAAVPAHDCAFGGLADPDGAVLRREKARTTRLFAPAHPAALATAAELPGITGLRARIPHASFIDDEVFAALDAARVSPAPLSSDAEFLRRVTLDLTGRIPDATTASSFFADVRPDKRARAIEQLLASDAFVDRWALYFDDLFRNTANADSGRLYAQGRNAFHAYFVAAIRGKKPYDAMAREMITTLGDNTVTAAVNFKVRNIQSNGPPQDTYDNLASDVGRAFLGLNIFCTSCHNGRAHTDSINLYLSTVNRSDFWGMSAYFARGTIRRSGTVPGDYSYMVGERASGEYLLNTTTGNKSPRDGATWANGASLVTPKYVLGGATPGPGEKYDAALARSLTADPQFAKAAVNYVWKEMFTVGIVEPADSFDLLRQDPSDPPPDPWTVQPTHPALLGRLASEFAATGFDLRALLRLIANSSAYQLSSHYPGDWSDSYAPLLARHFARRLRAEEVLDAVTLATGVPASLPVAQYTTPVAWAGQLPDTLEPGGARNPYR